MSKTKTRFFIASQLYGMRSKNGQLTIRLAQRRADMIAHCNGGIRGGAHPRTGSSRSPERAIRKRKAS
jgi:hypothetical protein